VSRRCGPSLARIAALVAVLFALACQRGSGSAESPTDPHAGVSGADAAHLTFTAEQLERAGVEVAVAAPGELEPEVEGYGRVLDGIAVVEALGNCEAARAARDAARRELERLTALQQDEQNASRREVEAARAAAERASADFAAADARLVGLLGADARAQLRDLGALAGQLAHRVAALVRIDVPSGTDPPHPEQGAELRYPEARGALMVRYLGRAPDVDPTLPGWSFLFLVTGDPPPSGAVIRARLRTDGATLSGVAAPASALVRRAGGTFVFVERAPGAFERRAVTVRAHPDGSWFATRGLVAGERIVVSGAQELLSAELFAAGGADQGD
jgi:hypothetical protein